MLVCPRADAGLTMPYTDEVQNAAADANTGTTAGELLSNDLTAIGQHLNVPLKLYSTGTDSKLHVGASIVSAGDGAGKVRPPLSGALNTAWTDTTIDFQSGAVSGGTIHTNGSTFALPTITTGHYITMALGWRSDGTVDTNFSPDTSTLGAQQDVGLTFLPLAGEQKLGYVLLQATGAAAYKTAGSATAIIQMAVSGSPTIIRLLDAEASPLTTAGDLYYFSTKDDRLALGATGTVLHGGSSAPSYSQVVNADVATGAALAWSKLATGTANQLAYTNGSGVLTTSSNMAYNGSQVTLDLTDSYGGFKVKGASGGEASFSLQPDNVSDGATGQWIFYTNGSGLNSPNDFAMYDSQLSAPALILQSSTANVGIGTNNPLSKLSVGVGSVDGLRVTSSGSGYARIYGPGTGSYRNYGWAANYTSAGLFELQQSTTAAGDPTLTIMGTDGTHFGFGGGASGLNSTLNVDGNVSVGNAYYGTAAPVHGMIIQGYLGLGTTSPNTSLHVNGGTTMQGLSSPSLPTGSAGNGVLYFDTVAEKFLYSENNGTFIYWDTPAAAYTLTNHTISGTANTLQNLATEDDFTGDGTTTNFTLAETMTATRFVQVFVDGRVQREGGSYSWTRTNATPGHIVFNVAPDSGSWVDVTIVNQ
jgi:hypothetical protein